MKKIKNKHRAKLTGNKFMIFTIYGIVFAAQAMPARR